MTSQPGPNSAAPPARSPLPRRWLRGLLTIVGACALALWTAWAAAALYFDVRIPWLRAPLAVACVLAVLTVCVVVKRRWLAGGLIAGGCTLVLAWWFSLQPSNDRDWQPDLALLAHADIEGNQVTVRNIRNCGYRTEDDFDVQYYDKTFDLGKLRTADLFMVYWGSPNMAHTMVSFGFEGGDYVCFSIETRKERGESYSAIKGLFRQFELIYIAADERDVVRLRTNYREGEDAYLYRLNAPPAPVRELFLSYIRRMNDLESQPEWYHAVKHNCTTSIRMQRAASDRAPWDWRMLVNGYGNELLYERRAIATHLPLAELKERCRINERARTADQAADFSQQIRRAVPGIDP